MLPHRRALAATLAAGAILAITAVTLLSTSGSAHAAAPLPHRKLILKCLKTVLGVQPAPRAVAGSADPQVLARFAVLQDAAAAPPPARSGELLDALRHSDVTSYDPSRYVTLARTGSTTLYALPVTITIPTLPAGCSSLPDIRGIQSVVAENRLLEGTGPGVCLIKSTTSSVPTRDGPTIAPVPDVSVNCEAAINLDSYASDLGGTFGASTVLVPDGITALTFQFQTGAPVTTPVSGNLAALPARVSAVGQMLLAGDRAPTAAHFAAVLPTSVIDTTSTNPYAFAFPRPVSLIPDLLGAVRFLKDLEGTSSGSAGFGSSDEACHHATRRCTKVSVTTTCTTRRCRTTRTIRHFSYHGKPPTPNTTLTDSTAPIVGRADRRVTHRHVTVVLTGTPRQRVQVMASSACIANGSALGSVGPPLTQTLPSRTPLIVPARRGRHCFVIVLVTSGQPHPVTVSIKQ